MTPLQRAKAFIQTRAAKTALKIMPLALATVVSVGVTPKAHANTTPILDGTFKVWQFANCISGAPCLDNVNSSSSWNTYGANGVQGSGSLSGTLIQDTGMTATLDPAAVFAISGGGTGNFGSQAAFDFNFLVNCPNCDPTTQVTYHVADIVIDGNTLADQTGTLTLGTATHMHFLIATNSGDDVSDPANGWGADVTFAIIGGQDGANFTFDPVDMAFDPSPGTVPAPEPASMLLALAGLPFLGQVIRKKR